MGIDYEFYSRSCMEKYIKDIKRPGCIEGYRWDEAIIFCKLMGLPEIPYYYCYEDNPIDIKINENSKNYNRFYKLIFKGIDFPNKYENIIIAPAKLNNAKKHYYRYKHWENWGFQKLDSITIKDILNNAKIKRKDIYGNIQNLNEIKRDIANFVNYYKNHYYMFSSV